MSAAAQTLFSQVQTLFERTYSRVGLNLEHCLIDHHRCGLLTRLAGHGAEELHPAARTFLRSSGHGLHVAIYYSPRLIAELEREDPRRTLGDSNIHALIMFVEELNHALHAALCFLRGERAIQDEAFARNLELQGQVDTYLLLLFFVAGLRGVKRVDDADRTWIKHRMFGTQDSAAYTSANLRGRYTETRAWAERYTSHLDALDGLARLGEVRAFHQLDYAGKLARIAACTPQVLNAEFAEDAEPASGNRLSPEAFTQAAQKTQPEG